jgi:hypothetical protein
MGLETEHQLEVTRAKLLSLESRYQSVKETPGGDTHIQELTLQSLRRIINQMKEEIARFQSRESVHSRLK